MSEIPAQLQSSPHSPPTCLVLVLVPHSLVSLHLLPELRLELPLLRLLGDHAMRPQSREPVLVTTLRLHKNKQTRSLTLNIQTSCPSVFCSGAYLVHIITYHFPSHLFGPFSRLTRRRRVGDSICRCLHGGGAGRIKSGA